MRIDSTAPCKRGCCWTPYGHSTARDTCGCHTEKGTDQ